MNEEGNNRSLKYKRWERHQNGSKSKRNWKSNRPYDPIETSDTKTRQHYVPTNINQWFLFLKVYLKIIL